MKTIQIKALLMGLVLSVFSCEEREEAIVSYNTTSRHGFPPVTGSVQNLDASSDDTFVKYNFAKKSVVSGDDWDVAFQSTTILVNAGQKTSSNEPARSGKGGMYLATGLFDEQNDFKDDLLKKDGPKDHAVMTGSGNGWYTYNHNAHIITPISGRVFMIKTHDGHWAKMEISSYYKDSPKAPNYQTSESRYYNFRYTYYGPSAK
jgi:HmuY protein